MKMKKVFEPLNLSDEQDKWLSIGIVTAILALFFYVLPVIIGIVLITDLIACPLTSLAFIGILAVAELLYIRYTFKYGSRLCVRLAIKNLEVEQAKKGMQEKKAEELPKTICLVGSTRAQWKKRYRQVETELTMAGFVVVSVVWFKDQLPDFEKHRNLLEKIHFQKIRIAHAVVLIHPDAKGKHTMIEMAFAKTIGKPVISFRNTEQALSELHEHLRMV